MGQNAVEISAAFVDDCCKTYDFRPCAYDYQEFEATIVPQINPPAPVITTTLPLSCSVRERTTVVLPEPEPPAIPIINIFFYLDPRSGRG